MRTYIAMKPAYSNLCLALPTQLSMCRLDTSARRHHHRPHGAGPYTRAENNSGNQVGNSATKNGTHLSIGASTTLHDSGRHALVNTAEGRLPASRWGAAQRHHRPHEGSPDVEQPESCTTASLDDQQLEPNASAEASPVPEAKSGADTAAIADRGSQPQQGLECPAALMQTHKRSAACLSPASWEQSDAKRVAKGSCNADAATAPCGVEASLLTGAARLLQSHRQHDKRDADPQEAYASIPSEKTASDETNLNSLRLAELAHVSQSSDQPSSVVLLTVKPLLTGAQDESTDMAQPGLVVSSAYQQHHSQPPLHAAHQQHRRPVHVLHSQQQQSKPHAPIAVHPCMPLPSSGAPPLGTNIATAPHTLPDLLQLFASQQKHQQHAIPSPGAAVPPPSHAARLAAFTAQLGFQPAPPRSRDSDLHGMGHIETSAAAAAAAFFGSGMAPPLPGGHAGGASGHPKRADQRADMPAGLGSLPLDPLTAMSAFLQQLSHEHILAFTQVGVVCGGIQKIKWNKL